MEQPRRTGCARQGESRRCRRCDVAQENPWGAKKPPSSTAAIISVITSSVSTCAQNENRDQGLACETRKRRARLPGLRGQDLLTSPALNPGLPPARIPIATFCESNFSVVLKHQQISVPPSSVQPEAPAQPGARRRSNKNWLRRRCPKRKRE